MLKRRNLSSSRYKKVAITTIKDPDKKLAVKAKSKKCTESTHAEIIDAAMANPLRRLSANFITAVTSRPPTE